MQATVTSHLHTERLPVQTVLSITLFRKFNLWEPQNGGTMALGTPRVHGLLRNHLARAAKRLGKT